MDNDEILSRVEHLASAKDCKWIIIDHLSILVSGQEVDDERKSIDILMTKLRKLVEQTKVGMLLVSHLRRPSGDRDFNNGREVSLGHLRGSASIAQLSDSVIALERDQQADDPSLANVVKVRILKNRYCGTLGVACHLFYNKETGRIKQIQNPYSQTNDLSSTFDQAF
jgi:twinkle protein